MEEQRGGEARRKRSGGRGGGIEGMSIKKEEEQ